MEVFSNKLSIFVYIFSPYMSAISCCIHTVFGGWSTGGKNFVQEVSFVLRVLYVRLALIVRTISRENRDLCMPFCIGHQCFCYVTHMV